MHWLMASRASLCSSCDQWEQVGGGRGVDRLSCDASWNRHGPGWIVKACPGAPLDCLLCDLALLLWAAAALLGAGVVVVFPACCGSIVGPCSLSTAAQWCPHACREPHATGNLHSAACQRGHCKRCGERWDDVLGKGGHVATDKCKTRPFVALLAAGLTAHPAAFKHIDGVGLLLPGRVPVPQFRCYTRHAAWLTSTVLRKTAPCYWRQER